MPPCCQTRGCLSSAQRADCNGVKLAVSDLVEVRRVTNQGAPGCGHNNRSGSQQNWQCHAGVPKTKVCICVNPMAATATVADLNNTGSALWSVVPKTKVCICMKPMMSVACSNVKASG